jgi:hypothetical protein
MPLMPVIVFYGLDGKAKNIALSIEGQQGTATYQ